MSFVNLYIVDIHARLSVCRKGSDAIRVVNSREIAADCEIEKDEEKHGYYIDVKIQPAQKSKLYVLEITLKIADEIIKNREKMEVI